MDRSRHAKILVIDDDENVCEIVASFISFWGLDAETVSNPLSALSRIKGADFDIAMLDVCMPGVNGLDLIPDIIKCAENIKIIVMTGCADKAMAIKALRSGAFDFMEKPLDSELLFHTIYRALDARDKEREFKALVDELKNSQSALMRQKDRLEFLNSQLLETNRALSVLAQNIEREREETEKAIGIKLRSLILPVIETLRRDRSLEKHEAELEMLVNQIEDLTSDFVTDAKIAFSLSHSELRIASMVKHGLTTEDIAKQLHISASTVRTHRKNIRKKLKINNSAYSLRNFLISKIDNTSK